MERRIVVAAPSDEKDDADDDSKSKTQESSSKLICYFADIPLGLYVVRGDSIVLTGQLKVTTDGQPPLPPGATAVAAAPVPMKQVSLKELEDLTPAPGAATALEWDFDTDLIA